MRNVTRIVILIMFVAAIGVFFALDLQQYLTLASFNAQRATIESYKQANPELVTAVYLLVYLAVTALSLPGAALLTLIGGALFGLLWGTIMVSFASSIGATLAFLAARFVFRGWVQSRFQSRLTPIDQGIQREGAFYLFTLRLVPLFPFFLINLAMGLTSLRTWTFYWVSQLGMLAGTLVYVNAGTQLAHIESSSAILSPPLLASFTLLGLFPLLTKKIVDVMKRYTVYRRWSKPKHFDNNLVVIGAGSGGLVSAYIAAAAQAKVTLIEKHQMGGDCLNTGCVPSKALIRSAKWISHFQRHKEFGIKHAHVDFAFAEIMQRVQTVIKKVAPHDSVERYRSLGVDVIIGEAKIISPWEVQVTTSEGVTQITTRSIVIATGARPFVPKLPGIEQIPVLTSDNVWQLQQCPPRLLVLGGGPIGCELAQCFARLGSRVTLVEMAERLLIREDPDVSNAVTKRLRDEGIDVLTGHTAKAFSLNQNERALQVEHHGQQSFIAFDQVLVAIGRAAIVTGFGAEQLGITLSSRQQIDTNPFQQTNYPNIYAVGDVAGPYQFTHTAAHQAWYAAVNALFGRFKKFRTDYSVVPWSTFTEPEVARVGLNEQEAVAQNIAYEMVTYGIDDLDRAIADNEAHGFVKVLTRPGKDTILGVIIVGEHAGDLIAEFVLAMKHGIGLNKILATMHIYPTLSEANKYAAGMWKKSHVSPLLLTWLRRYHAWYRH